jgi:putative Mg2+ transporter-C (MgtC) family protein
VEIEWVVLLQIVVAAFLGAAVGLERELSAQPAGLRTHMLVSIGAALFTLAGVGFSGSDPTRIAAQVVTGIGFLGGGAILREGATIRGLTTAASLWVTAAIGLAVGLKRWDAAVFTTALGLLTLALLKYFEREVMPTRRMFEVVLTLEPQAALDEVERSVKTVLRRSRVLKVSYGPDGQSLVMVAQPQRDLPIAAIGERLRLLPGVHGVEVSR